jgi:hypothetical protein
MCFASLQEKCIIKMPGKLTRSFLTTYYNMYLVRKIIKKMHCIGVQYREATSCC